MKAKLPMMSLASVLKRYPLPIQWVESSFITTFATDANTYYTVVAVCTCNYLMYSKFDRCFDMMYPGIYICPF